MPPKTTAIDTSSRSSSHSICKISSLFLIFILLSTLSLLLFFLLSTPTSRRSIINSSSHFSETLRQPSINVYVADLPRSLNYDLLSAYWSSSSTQDSRLKTSLEEIKHTHLTKYPPYPENPLIKQYSAEYWLLGDLIMDEELRSNASFAKRVFDLEDADVVFVPFFGTLSAEMELGNGKGLFRKKVDGNEDYQRQKMVIDIVKKSHAWKRSGGRDHVFVLTDPVAMWHVRAEISTAILLVVDFGGWYRVDSKSSSINSSNMIQHTQVSLLKDVIVPYTHLLPRLDMSENKRRPTLLYFKGAKHRHRGGLIREKLWDLLVKEKDVVMEEGFPNATGREQSIKGMRTSDFCLHPAGDTPTSCRLFDAIQSLCIPVIISDNIELPFEGIIDYSTFSIFVAVSDALQLNWLISHLRDYSKEQKDAFRRNMARVQGVFEYDSGKPGGLGPIPADGAVNHIWRKIHQKLPMIKEAIVREKRKPAGVAVPLRCHCT